MKQKSFIVFLILSFHLTLFGQTWREYSINKLTKVDSSLQLDGYNIREIYKFQGDTLIIIAKETANYGSHGLQLIIARFINRSLNPVFLSNEQGDSFFIRPYYSWTGSLEDSKLILCEIGTEYSWGIQAFIIKGESIEYIGLLDVSIDNNGSESSNPVSCLKIRTDGVQIDFNFTKDLIYKPGKLDKKISFDKIWYSYKKDQFLEIIK
jgi:hypothetical protein